MKCSEITYRPLSEMVLLESNPRTIKKADMDRLVDSIKIYGFWKHRPITLSDRTGKLVVIAGNQRLKAAKKLKLKEVPTVVYSDLTEDEEKNIILRDNINNGEWDFNALQVDDVWKDTDFSFIGLTIPEDAEPKKSKKKAVEEDEPEDEAASDEQEDGSEEANERLSTAPCSKMFCMRATTFLRSPTCFWKCKPENWSCRYLRGVQTAV